MINFVLLISGVFISSMILMVVSMVVAYNKELEKREKDTQQVFFLIDKLPCVWYDLSMKKIKKYQVALSSPAGVSPQREELFDSKRAASAWVRKLNNRSANPYAQYIVLEKEYLVSEKRRNAK